MIIPAHRIVLLTCRQPICKIHGLQYYHVLSTSPLLQRKSVAQQIVENRKTKWKIEGANDRKHSFKYFGSTKNNFGASKDIGSLHQSLAPPLLLGISGLIPFIAPPLMMYSQAITCTELVDAQLAYGAVILSFLGGVRWGMAATPGGPIPGSWSQYCWSVIPSLIAWGGLILPGVTTGYATVIAGLSVTCYKDLAQTGYPAWFRGLRLFLTLVAVVSLGSSLAIIYNFPDKKTLTDTVETSKAQLEIKFNSLMQSEKPEEEQTAISQEGQEEDADSSEKE